jgi:S1-C subfamily serine protease
VFFLSPDGKVYARYGGRDARGPDELQSLDGLRHTMSSVLAMHRSKDRAFAPRSEGPSRTVRQVPGGTFRRGCMHCHNVREVLDRELKQQGKWDRALAWRYPLPDNLGLVLEVNRGNVVERVAPGSAAAKAGLQKGDVLRLLNGVPTHSIADAQFALDRAPSKGQVAVAWERTGERQSATLALADGWRRYDLSWRPSLHRLVPTLPLYGTDLTEAEKKALGLPAKQLAFRQRDSVSPRAKAAGVQAGDVIHGIDGRELRDLGAADLRQLARREYLIGDRVQIDVLRGGKRISLPMTLR